MKVFRSVLAVLAVVMCCHSMMAAEKLTLLVWGEKGAPDAKGKGKSDIPTLTITFPEKGKANGTAVIICPGGCYAGLAMSHEGYQVAKWMNSIGITAAVLKYRLPTKGYRHPCPLNDLQRSIQLMRFKSNELGINPDRIGIFGSSAGGHLVSTAATHFVKADPNAADSLLHYSTRPDFLIMLYPVINNHRGSFYNLLGQNPDPKVLENLKNDKQVTSGTPPTFIVHANDDGGVTPMNTIDFYLALCKNKVPAEIHIYEKGGHGFGMHNTQWLTPLNNWLSLHGWLKK